ncbi:unnamed protein product [Cyclocybe aegerita]|uniref:Nephrocystin 3-like N-terminal domain-containing protein n=1 Tax=Cyclocybe aegerita TaxID=1973307 RepID=A0A8S0WT31_CYCAE|nr:unnamed protein product [Cyclocybe aegerita]
MSDLNSLVAASMLELWLCQQLLPLHDLPARWDNNKLSSPGYPLSIMDLFRDSQNNTLKDSIIIASQFGYRVAFDQFHAQIAEGAMHDSGERFDPPKCYPGTREVVLKQLLDWIIAHDRESFMHWLHGPAGAGKSAILQEIAERCAQMKLLIASFFFSRTAALRNNKKRLVATLAYQLAQSVPETRPYIEKAIGHDPAIFSKRLQSQFQALIVEPLSQAASTAGEDLYAVIPANSLLGSRDIFDVLLAPAQSPELQSAILIDDSSLRLRDWFEGQFMYNKTIYADEHRYASFIRKLLEPEDFTKAAKVLVSHIISYQ